MSLSTEQLKELTQLGEIQFTLPECATVLQCPIEALREPQSIEAYQRGRLIASAAVRRAILQQAKQGSTPAQKQMIELINAANKQETMRSQKNLEELSKSFENIL